MTVLTQWLAGGFTPASLPVPGWIWTSWPSLLAVPFVWGGYLLQYVFKRLQAGIVCLIASQLALILMGAVDGEWALPLLIVPVTLGSLLFALWRERRRARAQRLVERCNQQAIEAVVRLRHMARSLDVEERPA